MDLTKEMNNQVSKKTSILFYGPIGNKVGGGESGNKKTIKVLTDNGYTVRTLAKPYPKKTVSGYFLYLIRLIKVIFKFRKLIRCNDEFTIIHISGFYSHLIYHELILLYISKVYRLKCVYELRAGGVIDLYKSKSFIYRFTFNKAIKIPTTILSQGKNYIPFLRGKSSVKIIHYPNYVMNEFINLKVENSLSNRGKCNQIKLIYFGRITPSKNIKGIIKILHLLTLECKDIKLEMIGKCSKEYKNDLIHLIKVLEVEDYVSIISPLETDELKQRIEKAHFFIFPSCEKREGQSNSLTEAMSLGVVPVCSNAGFNREIIGFNELIIEDINSYEDYSDCIIKIWENNLWSSYSKRVRDIIKQKYTEEVVSKTLIDVYKSINFNAQSN